MGSSESLIDIKMWSLRSKVWMSAWKYVPICLNLLTVLYTDAVISTSRDSWVPGGLETISSIHVQLISANFKGPSKLVSYMKFCLYHMFDSRRRDLEIPLAGWLALNYTIINQCSRCFQDPINDLTVVADDERCSGRHLLFGNGIFNIESIPIWNGGTPIDVTKVALDHSEVAIHQDDSSGVPDTK